MTVNISDLRCRLKEQEVPLKSHLDARLTVEGRSPWLPGPARAHTEGIHSLVATVPLTRLVRPQQQTELSVLVPELSLHRINCNNWQVGCWLLGFNSPGAHEKKKNLAVPPQPMFSLGSKKLQLSMTRNKRCGCSCPGKTSAPEQPWRKRPPLANNQFTPWGKRRKLPLTCCPSREHQIMEKK